MTPKLSSVLTKPPHHIILIHTLPSMTHLKPSYFARVCINILQKVTATCFSRFSMEMSGPPHAALINSGTQGARTLATALTSPKCSENSYHVPGTHTSQLLLSNCHTDTIKSETVLFDYMLHPRTCSEWQHNPCI